jgi:DNA-binding MarR family transcriptional regulator
VFFASKLRCAQTAAASTDRKPATSATSRSRSAADWLDGRIGKDEFDRKGRSDINAVQALLLFNIGDEELTAGELRTRGYYLGSNVSYNLKKLVEMGFLDHQRSRVDRRAVRIKLTEKGHEVCDTVRTLFDKHGRTVHQVGGISGDEFAGLNKSLHRLERFWTDQILYRL